MLEKLYEIEQSPPSAISWDEYHEQAAHELSRLLEEYSDDESVFQKYFERNPGMLMGAFTVHGESGHMPHNMCLITQPELGRLGWKRVPDFVWLAQDSIHFSPVFIEIEKPSKKMFTQANLPTAEFTQAKTQIDEWKILLNDGNIRSQLFDYFHLPTELREDYFDPQFLLVYGRRSEFDGDQRKTKLRAQVANGMVLVSYDRLLAATSSKYIDLLCCKMQDDKYKVITIPPTYCYRPMTADVLGAVEGFTDCIDSMERTSDERKKFLKRRFQYWYQRGPIVSRGLVHSSDKE